MIGIINYGLGNIKAISNVYHKLDIPVKMVQRGGRLYRRTKTNSPRRGRNWTMRWNCSMKHQLSTFLILWYWNKKCLF